MITVYYSIQKVGSFGVVPSSINSANEKAMALAITEQEIRVTWGDLKIVILVCDHLTDSEIYEGINFTKQLAIGAVPGKKSDYFEED